MYYFACFINYRPFLYEKIKSFLDENTFDILTYNRFEDLPFIFNHSQTQENFLPESLCLHGSHLNQTESEKVELPLLEGTCLNEINILFDEYSRKYSWSILPWGSVYSSDLLSSFMFITNEEKFFNKFMNSYPNTIDIKSRYGHIISQNNLLISSYQVRTKFSKTTQAILIEDDFDCPGGLIWDACQLDSCPPLFISEVYCSDEINDFYDIGNPDLESPIYWERANYEPLEIIDVHIKENNTDIYPHNNKKLGVYQPQDRQSFIDICKSLRQGTETLIVVPYNTNLTKLTKLLAKIEASDYSDLSYIQDILHTTNWLYGLNRNYVDIGDNMYSLFVSSNNILIQKIDELNKIKNDKLISFF